jgi:hypothetical protein
MNPSTQGVPRDTVKVYKENRINNIKNDKKRYLYWWILTIKLLIFKKKKKRTIRLLKKKDIHIYMWHILNKIISSWKNLHSQKITTLSSLIISLFYEEKKSYS